MKVLIAAMGYVVIDRLIRSRAALRCLHLLPPELAHELSIKALEWSDNARDVLTAAAERPATPAPTPPGSR